MEDRRWPFVALSMIKNRKELTERKLHVTSSVDPYGPGVAIPELIGCPLDRAGRLCRV